MFSNLSVLVLGILILYFTLKNFNDINRKLILITRKYPIVIILAYLIHLS